MDFDRGFSGLRERAFQPIEATPGSLPALMLVERAEERNAQEQQQQCQEDTKTAAGL